MGREIDFLKFPSAKRSRVSTEKARKIAKRFDREFFDGKRENGYGGYVYDGRWKPVARRLCDHYGLDYGDTVLDVGCAKGFLVKDLTNEGIDATGIDVSEYAISKAVTDRVYVCDARELRFDAEEFDLAVSINTLHNLKEDEIAAVLSEMGIISVHQYIVLDAFKTKAQEKRIRDWNLTAQTILHVDDWKKLFKRCGYNGDYAWTVMR